MQIPVLLDRSRREPLTNQLVDQLRDAIRHARIRGGTRLPSSRRLSEQLSVSRNTVIRAYDTLIVEGYVESRPASGIFVAETLPGMPVEVTAHAREAARGVLTHMPMPPLPLHVQSMVDRQRNRLSFDFFPGRPSPALFPVKTWRRLLQTALSHGGGTGMSQYGDPAGLPALRSAIADHLATTRGIAADPGRIVVTNGAQEGISIATRLFLNHGTPSAIEDPCYQGAAFAFEATGSEITSVAVDFEGLIPEELPRRPTALLYVTPPHQYPIGHTLSLDRRYAIVAWARRYGCYVLEDDRDGDLRYEGSPLQAIAASAPDCTIYLGTFSRTLGAGLRLGYMVVPEHLAGVVAAAKGLLNNGNSWLEQAALAEMMRAGSYAAHLQRSRVLYRENRDYLLIALRRNFGDISVTGESGGLHLVWYLPPGVPNAVVVEGLARRARIGVYSFTSGSAYVARASTLTQRGLMLGYAALSRKQIEQGIARLSDAIDDAVDDPNADVSALFVKAAVPPPAPKIAKKARNLDPSFLRQPALAGRRHRRRSLAVGAVRRAGNVMVAVSKIYRYPIKGLSAQPLSSIVLEADKPFPRDRMFALVRPGAPIDRNDPKWAKKGLFVMLMLEENLARVNTSLDVDSLLLTVKQGQSTSHGGAACGRSRPHQGRKLLLAIAANSSGAADPGPLRRRSLHGQARQRRFLDQSGDGAQPRAAMGRRNRSTAFSRQHLRRRRPALGGVRLGRQRDQDRRRGVCGGSQERPLRRHQRQSHNRTARPRYSGLAVRRFRSQKSRRLSDRPRRRGNHRRRFGLCAACRAVADGRLRTAGAGLEWRATPLYVPRLLFHLRGGQGSAAAIDTPGNGLCGYAGELAMSRLRHGQNDIPPLRRKGGSRLKPGWARRRNPPDGNWTSAQCGARAAFCGSSRRQVTMKAPIAAEASGRLNATPPSLTGLSRKSPTVAPSGRDRMNAAQNKNTRNTLVR